MLTLKKTFVYTLIFLLTATATIGVFAPATAETWTDITLPYTITESGNYRIASAWNGSGIALAVNVSNVVVDGQNYLITMSRSEGDNGVRINNGSENVLLENLKVRNAYVGVHARSDNFTVMDSTLNLNAAGIFANCSNHFDVLNCNLTFNLIVNLFAKNSSHFTVENCNILNGTLTGVIATYSNNFEFKNCNINNNPAGFLTRCSQNFSLSDNQLNNNRAMGFLAGQIENFTFSGNELTNSTLGSMVASSSNLEILNSDFGNNSFGLMFSNVTNLAMDNCIVGNNIFGTFFQEATQFILQGCTYQDNELGVIIEESANFTVSDSIINNGTEALLAYEVGNCTIENTVMDNNRMGIDFEDAGNLTITNCTLSSGYFGAMLFESNFILQRSAIINNSLCGVYAPLASNSTVANNLIKGNGAYLDDFCGGIRLPGVNCTVTDNIFENNRDALMWDVFSDEEITYTQYYTNNIFTNNSYTLSINYDVDEEDYANEQFYFYGNFVNDSAYVDPIGLSESEGFMPFNRDIFHFNTTMQEGERIYSDGRMVGGNYWAFSNGTGPSQTTTDANHDGFADEPFDLFGDGAVVDYLPYSSGYISNLTFTDGTNQNLVANQTSTVVSVQYIDYFGIITSGVTVNLSSNSSTAKFYSDSEGTNPITSITIPSGSSVGNFYFKDINAGNPTTTVSAPKATSATTEFTINPHADKVDHIVIVPQNPTIKADETITFTTMAYDQYGNGWEVEAEYTVMGESFNGNLTGGMPGYYYIESAYQGNSSSTTLAVNPGDVNRYLVFVPSSATAGSAFTIGVNARDSVGNIATNFNGKVTLSANGTTITPTTSGNLKYGEWIGTVTIPEAGTYVITATDENGNTGKSVAFTVNSASIPSPTVTPTLPPQTVPATKDDGSIVNLEISGNITTSQISNLQINSNQTEQTTIVSFNVTGPSGTNGFSNMTIPKNTVPEGTTPTVYIDGEIAENQGYTEDNQNFYVWFITSFSQHRITIEFTGKTNPAYEQPLLLYALAIFVVVVIAAVLVFSKRRQK